MDARFVCTLDLRHPYRPLCPDGCYLLTPKDIWVEREHVKAKDVTIAKLQARADLCDALRTQVRILKVQRDSAIEANATLLDAWTPYQVVILGASTGGVALVAGFILGLLAF